MITGSASKGGIDMEIFTIGQRPQHSTMPEFLPTRAGMPVFTPLANRIPEPRGHQLISDQLAWRELGQVCVQGGTSKAQDGQVAEFGGYDVTDTKFSTRVGPPPCSPPV
jgi:hypothetical protein